ELVVNGAHPVDRFQEPLRKDRGCRDQASKKRRVLGGLHGAGEVGNLIAGVLGVLGRHANLGLGGGQDFVNQRFGIEGDDLKLGAVGKVIGSLSGCPAGCDGAALGGKVVNARLHGVALLFGRGKLGGGTVLVLASLGKSKGGCVDTHSLRPFFR